MNLKGVVAKFLEVGEFIPGFAPFAKGALMLLGPRAAPSGDHIVDRTLSTFDHLKQTIIDVETFGQLANTPGPEKARIAAPMIDKALEDAFDTVGFEVADKDAARAAAQRIGGDLADYMNALKKK